MPSIKFLPQDSVVPAEQDTKILLVAIRSKIPIRYGCGACRCGTCAVAVTGPMKPMARDEEALLTRMHLPTDGSVRLACRARIDDGDVTVDLDFQNTYNPADANDDLD